MQVSPGTPSDGELLAGDVILQIQGSDAARFTHLQAQDQVRKAGGSLLLRILRLKQIFPLAEFKSTQQPNKANICKQFRQLSILVCLYFVLPLSTFREFLVMWAKLTDFAPQTLGVMTGKGKT